MYIGERIDEELFEKKEELPPIEYYIHPIFGLDKNTRKYTLMVYAEDKNKIVTDAMGQIVLEKDGSPKCINGSLIQPLVFAYDKIPSTKTVLKDFHKRMGDRNESRKNINLPEIIFDTFVATQRITLSISSFDIKSPVTTPDDVDKEKFDDSIMAEAKKIVIENRLMEYFIKTISKFHFGDNDIKSWVLIAHLSKYVEKCINLSFTGESASGKSSCVFKCVYALPKHQVLILANSSEKALYYYCKEDTKALQFKTVYIDEANPNMYGMIKSLTNPDGIPTAYLTIIDGEVVKLVAEGPYVVMISSVLALTEQEMKNRFLNPEGEINKKTKEKIDEDILKAGMQDKLWKYKKLVEDIDYITCRCAVQYLTENYKIDGGIIPDKFFLSINKYTHIMNRSDKISFLTICKTIAYINITKRGKTTDNQVIVTKEDIDFAEEIWISAGTKLSTTQKNILDLFERESDMDIDENGKTTETYYDFLTITKITEFIREIYTKSISRKSVERAVIDLVEMGLVDKHGGGQGTTSKYCLSGYKISENNKPINVNEKPKAEIVRRNTGKILEKEVSDKLLGVPEYFKNV